MNGRKIDLTIQGPHTGDLGQGEFLFIVVSNVRSTIYLFMKLNEVHDELEKTKNENEMGLKSSSFTESHFLVPLLYSLTWTVKRIEFLKIINKYRTY